MLLHVLADLVGHLLVETSQQDGPHHHGRVEALKQEDVLSNFRLLQRISN
jgi:hypothetical protein